ncbi:MAG TPA: LysM peptidoglycan-binding domain-containing protein, partial [Candidatus Hypogeohydataceae bacterium YC38]
MSKKSVIRRVETQVGIAVGVISLSVMGVFLGIKKGEQKHEEPVSLTRVEEDTSDILDLSAIEKAPTAASLAAPTTEIPSAPGVKPSEQTREELMATADSVDEEKSVAEAPATLGVAGPEKVGEVTTSTTKDSLPIMHTVAANDTLMSLARQYYGDGTKWGLIYEANNLSHRDRLVVGQKLVIPNAVKAAEKE